MQTFQLAAGTKGLNTWHQLGCHSINQGDPGVSIPAVLCCPEAKKQWWFSLFFPNPLSFSNWQRWKHCRGREQFRGCAVGAAGLGPTGLLRCDMKGARALPQGTLCKPLWPLHQVHLGLRHRHQLQHLQRCSSGQVSGVHPRLSLQLAEGDRQFKDVSHLTPYI